LISLGEDSGGHTYRGKGLLPACGLVQVKGVLDRAETSPGEAVRNWVSKEIPQSNRCNPGQCLKEKASLGKIWKKLGRYEFLTEPCERGNRDFERALPDEKEIGRMARKIQKKKAKGLQVRQRGEVCANLRLQWDALAPCREGGRNRFAFTAKKHRLQSKKAPASYTGQGFGGKQGTSKLCADRSSRPEGLMQLGLGRESAQLSHPLASSAEIQIGGPDEGTGSTFAGNRAA